MQRILTSIFLTSFLFAGVLHNAAVAGEVYVDHGLYATEGAALDACGGTSGCFRQNANRTHEAVCRGDAPPKTVPWPAAWLSRDTERRGGDIYYEAFSYCTAGASRNRCPDGHTTDPNTGRCIPSDECNGHPPPFATSGSATLGAGSADLDGNGVRDGVVNTDSGIWRWMNESQWVQLHTRPAEAMVAGDLDGNGQDDVVVDFGTSLWRWMNNSRWEKLHTVSPEHMVAGDLDGNGQDDVVIDFGTSLWRWMNNSAWVKLHARSPADMIVTRLDTTKGDDVIIDFGTSVWSLRNNKTWVVLVDAGAATKAAALTPAATASFTTTPLVEGIQIAQSYIPGIGWIRGDIFNYEFNRARAQGRAAGAGVLCTATCALGGTVNRGDAHKALRNLAGDVAESALKRTVQKGLLVARMVAPQATAFGIAYCSVECSQKFSQCDVQ